MPQVQPKPKPAPCSPAGCEHSDSEHRAFDAGVRAGQRNPDIKSSRCPYRTPNLREAWWTGHSVGALNRKADEIVVKAVCNSKPNSFLGAGGDLMFKRVQRSPLGAKVDIEYTRQKRRNVE